MAISSNSDNDDVVSEINVTPLVDVMLVLVVVFIVTAPLLANAIKVNLPRTSTTAIADEKKPLSLSIDSGGRIFVDKQEVQEPALEHTLKELKAARGELAIHLNADEVVNYGQVARVLAVVDRAGVSRLSVMTHNER